MNIRMMILSCLMATQFLSAQSLTERIDSLLENSSLAASAQIGIRVVDVSHGGTAVYDYQSKRLLRPASTEKIITSVAAADLLGLDFPITTKIGYTGVIRNDTLWGDIYLKGDMDSELNLTELYDMASAAIRKLSVSYVKGRIHGDASWMEPVYYGPGWCWDDAATDYQPYLSPLMVNKGCLDINISPMSAGEKADVEFMPLLSDLVVDNQTVSKKSGKQTLDVSWGEGRNLPFTIQFHGRVTHDTSLSISPIDSKSMTLAAFTEMIRSQGCEIDSQRVSFIIAPDSVEWIVTKHRELRDVVLPALKNSDNVSAEALFLHLGKRASGDKPTSFKRAAKRMNEYLVRNLNAVRGSDFQIVDGSGLSLYNYLTPHLLTDILYRLYTKKKLYNVLKTCLPEAGVDGTLSRRMKSTDGRVHAKTGTVTGVSSLAGFVDSKNNSTYAFAILINGVLDRKAAHELQDKICECLVDGNWNSDDAE